MIDDEPTPQQREIAINIFMGHLLNPNVVTQSAVLEADAAIQKAKNASLPKEKSAGRAAPKPGAATGPDTDGETADR